jgi:hypothetical protein
VHEADARRVFEALADPTWDFRTIDGLAESTGVPKKRIEEILPKYRALVRQALVLDRLGRELYTLSSRASTFRELLTNARAFISKSPWTA